MFCNKCGNQINEGDKFCTKCGTPVSQERLCPKCQCKLPDGAAFCGQCGAKVSETPQFTPANSGSSSYVQNNSGYQPNPGYHAGFNPQQPQKYSMISKYVGEPTAGIAKATGTLAVYTDHLEYTKTFGSSLGNAFGLVGMAVAAKKANQDGKVEIYNYQDIQTTYVGKYMAMMPTVVLVMNDGQVFSFCGTFTNQTASNVVNTILYCKENH